MKPRLLCLLLIPLIVVLVGCSAPVEAILPTGSSAEAPPYPSPAPTPTTHLSTNTPIPTATLEATATFQLRDAPAPIPFDACLLLNPVEVHKAITPYNPNTSGQPTDPASLPIPVSSFDLDQQRQSLRGACDYGRFTLTVLIPGPFDDLDLLMATFQEGKGYELAGEVNERYAAYWSQQQATLSVRAFDRWLILAVDRGDGTPDPRAEYESINALVSSTFPRMSDVLAGAYPSPTPYFNACDALSREQAEAILGPLIANPIFSAAIGEEVGVVEECIFEGTLNMAYIQMQRWPTAQDAAGSFRQWTGSSGEAVSLIGDESLWDEALLRLAVRRGEVTFYVTMSLAEGARDQAIRIAQVAAVRIP